MEGHMPTSQADASPELLEEYKQWLALGEGGIAYNWEGFMICKHFEKTVARDDTTDPSLYDSTEVHAPGWDEATEAQRKATQASFLSLPLPERDSPRARAKPFIFPQRERNEKEPQDEEIRNAYQFAVSRLSEVNDDLHWKTSVLERHGPALFLQDSLLPATPLAKPTQGEICHVHRSDLSAHVTLSFPDAKEVLQKGWGERHRLSGTERLHLGYTMLYVPRSVQEVEVLASILQAGIDYMKSNKHE
ncbi:hypothetical protein CB0940_01814 [Cercospora beticola]|uniref:Luciferase domain-containing protein n=1 Tax=Cercospora beticola TaxID=122368 RepID=A0A2G5ID56_CERBT|nr:hypothetical protein CB0940_01814 [Cercospora beticola]PIB02413.1 hypothetical protein CB0940_01814 [Cercospora beticola]WPA97265.1 hypothetical protein RHO25_001874 [Cercospora beticola]CAK1354318.1 unnamed protein product [Cercospora beticola]